MILVIAKHYSLAQLARSEAQSGDSRNSSATRAAQGKPRIDELEPGEDPQNRLLAPFLSHLVSDQKDFWTRPLHFHKTDIGWTLPVSGAIAPLIAGDAWISRQIPDKPNQLQRSLNISKYATYSLAGATGGALLWGHLTRNDHLRETGLLAAEAALNSTAVTFSFKQVTQRSRPFEGDGNGGFFRGGGSFPSEHTALAWSMGSVLAHEYPGPLTKVAAYGIASAVTLTRITSKQHFASDAVVGSLLGWYFGRQVYRAHHDPELGGSSWGNFLEFTKEPGTRDPRNMASPYVPPDNWVYPLFDRLAALGFVESAYVGIRPWTRMQCARLIEEASEKMRYESSENGEAEHLFNTLSKEFADELDRLNGAPNLGAKIESVYTRVQGISGPPLRDGYHFGQTIINDNGRPYAEGADIVSGLSTYAVLGPVSIYLRGEYQHAPAAASASLSVLQATAIQDQTLPLANGTPAIDRLRLLDGSVALTFRNLQFSFGRQPLWLGPGDAGPFLFSNNAESIPMLRIDQTSPLEVPGLSKLIGPMRTQWFIGQLSGQHWIGTVLPGTSVPTLVGPSIGRQPFIHGSKISFKPTANLEFGLGFTVLFGGPGLPVTWRNFYRTFGTFNVMPGSANDPGDRRSTFDFQYRVPHLRDWLTIYADSFVEDEFSPLGSTRPSMRLGMYLPRLPKVPKLDLRMEGLYTDVPGQKPGGFLYWNGRYRSGYTNDGNLLASWIGRQGRGAQAWATYWLSARSKMQLSYRHATVDQAFLQGGHLNDYGLSGEFMMRHDLGFSASGQYEQWRFPILSPLGKSNVTLAGQLTFYPNWNMKK
jgi:membrane-associated phospholipid phosphatase